MASSYELKGFIISIAPFLPLIYLTFWDVGGNVGYPIND